MPTLSLEMRLGRHFFGMRGMAVRRIEGDDWDGIRRRFLTGDSTYPTGAPRVDDLSHGFPPSSLMQKSRRLPNVVSVEVEKEDAKRR